MDVTASIPATRSNTLTAQKPRDNQGNSANSDDDLASLSHRQSHRPNDIRGGIRTRAWILITVTAGLAITFLGGPEPANAGIPTLKRCALIRQSFTRRECIIRSVFREHGPKAVRVAYCESGLNPRARNGQHRGIFQMGSSERRRFGHGRTVLAQAVAAKRYHDISGWTPWECS